MFSDNCFYCFMGMKIYGSGLGNVIHMACPEVLKMYYINIIQLCSEMTCSRGLNGELSTQRLQKLIYLHLFGECLMKISLRSSEQIF